MKKALFDSLPPEDYKDKLLVLGGDGRYFNREAAQVMANMILSFYFMCLKEFAYHMLLFPIF